MNGLFPEIDGVVRASEKRRVVLQSIDPLALSKPQAPYEATTNREVEVPYVEDPVQALAMLGSESESGGES